jgi:hypothetical protein
VFLLRMYRGITIDFRCGSLKYLCLDTLGKAKHIDGTVDRGLGRLDRVELIMEWGGRTGQIIYLIHLDIERKTDIMPKHLKIGVCKERCDICTIARVKIVNTNDFMTEAYKSTTEVGTDKPRPTGYENSFVQVIISHTDLLSPK